MLQKMSKTQVGTWPGFEPRACKEKQSREPKMTCPGFEPGACIYLAALTAESSQLLKSRQEMVKDSHKGLTTCPGFEPVKNELAHSLDGLSQPGIFHLLTLQPGSPAWLSF